MVDDVTDAWEEYEPETRSGRMVNGNRRREARARTPRRVNPPAPERNVNNLPVQRIPTFLPTPIYDLNDDMPELGVFVNPPEFRAPLPPVPERPEPYEQENVVDEIVHHRQIHRPPDQEEVRMLNRILKKHAYRLACLLGVAVLGLGIKTYIGYRLVSNYASKTSKTYATPAVVQELSKEEKARAARRKAFEESGLPVYEYIARLRAQKDAEKKAQEKKRPKNTRGAEQTPNTRPRTEDPPRQTTRRTYIPPTPPIRNDLLPALIKTRGFQDARKHRFLSVKDGVSPGEEVVQKHRVRPEGRGIVSENHSLETRAQETSTTQKNITQKNITQESRTQESRNEHTRHTTPTAQFTTPTTQFITPAVTIEKRRRMAAYDASAVRRFFRVFDDTKLLLWYDTQDAVLKAYHVEHGDVKQPFAYKVKDYWGARELGVKTHFVKDGIYPLMWSKDKELIIRLGHRFVDYSGPEYVYMTQERFPRAVFGDCLIDTNARNKLVNALNSFQGQTFIAHTGGISLEKLVKQYKKGAKKFYINDRRANISEVLRYATRE